MQRFVLAALFVAAVVAIGAVLARGAARLLDGGRGTEIASEGGSMQRTAYILLLALMVYVTISGAG